MATVFPLKSDSLTGVIYSAQTTDTDSPVGAVQITTAQATGTIRGSLKQIYTGTVSGPPSPGDVAGLTIGGVDYAFVAFDDGTDATATGVTSAATNGNKLTKRFTPKGTPRPAAKQTWTTTVSGAPGLGDVVSYTIGGTTYSTMCLSDATTTTTAEALKAAVNNGSKDARSFGIYGSPISNDRVHCVINGVTYTYSVDGGDSPIDVAMGLAAAINGDSVYDVDRAANVIYLRAKAVGAPVEVTTFVVAAPGGTTITAPETKVTGTATGSDWVASRVTNHATITNSGFGPDNTPVSVAVTLDQGTTTVSSVNVVVGCLADTVTLKLGGETFSFVTTNNVTADVLTGIVAAVSGSYTAYSDGVNLYVRAPVGLTTSIAISYTGAVSWAGATLLSATTGQRLWNVSNVDSDMTVEYFKPGLEGHDAEISSIHTGDIGFSISEDQAGRDGDIAALSDGETTFSYETQNGDTVNEVAIGIWEAMNGKSQFGVSYATDTDTIAKQGPFVLTDVSVWKNGAGGVAFTITDVQSASAPLAVTAPTCFRLDGATTALVGCALLGGTSYKAHVFLRMDSDPFPAWYEDSSTVISGNQVVTVNSTGYDSITVQVDTFVGNGVAQVTLQGSK